ncbi:MAG: hypothetical protein Q8918_17905 [Bacteroidota bacterium]|nr:hypothetical protein [Bacteroidota bacterium]MDP4213885.1 hypothetical protein [Bacteroidota bacterium]MDP4251979.1 hypothetical protein [Bacteroidota bacterium]
MNIALSAVIIFILLLPPIAFYFAFSSIGRFPKSGPKLGLFEGLMLSSIVAGLLHATVLFFIHDRISFDVLAVLLGGDLKTFGQVAPNETFKPLFESFIFYCAGLTVSSIILGFVCRLIVQHSGLHARSELLRLYNKWWYLFNGYKVDGFINSANPVEFDILFIDVLVNTNDGTMLYSGYLIDFVCSGEILERLYLSETIKRDFKKGEMNEKGNILVNVSGDPLEIDGDTMVVPFSTVINMNLHFITFSTNIDNVLQNTDISDETSKTVK